MKRVDRKTFHLIAAQPIAAVMGELIHLQLHPNIAPLQASLLAELALYHEEAVAVVPTPDQQWQFWRACKQEADPQSVVSCSMYNCFGHVIFGLC